jgi:hypothetical protein
MLARHPAGTAAKAILKKGMKWIAKRHKTISKQAVQDVMQAQHRSIEQAETDRIKSLVAAGLMGVEYGEAEEPTEEEGG